MICFVVLRPLHLDSKPLHQIPVKLCIRSHLTEFMDWIITGQMYILKLHAPGHWGYNLMHRMHNNPNWFHKSGVTPVHPLCPILTKLCTEQGNDIAVFCTRFQSSWTTRFREIWVENLCAVRYATMQNTLVFQERRFQLPAWSQKFKIYFINP